VKFAAVRVSAVLAEGLIEIHLIAGCGGATHARRSLHSSVMRLTSFEQ